MIVSGRNQPSVAGSAGSVMALKTVRTPETRPDQVQLIGAGAWAWLPVKSHVTPLLVISTRTLTGNGPLPRPSASGHSAAVMTPAGILAAASRLSASLRAGHCGFA